MPSPGSQIRRRACSKTQNQTGHYPEFAVELVEQVDACIPLTVTNMNDVRHERPLSS
jgi:hypothetical protein